MAGLVINNDACYSINQGIVFDLNDYPDISMDDFEKYLFEHFNIEYIDLLNGKYRVLFTFHRDYENNTIAVTAEIVDWSSVHEPDSRLDKLLDKIVEQQEKRKKRESIKGILLCLGILIIIVLVSITGILYFIF